MGYGVMRLSAKTELLKMVGMSMLTSNAEVFVQVSNVIRVSVYAPLGCVAWSGAAAVVPLDVISTSAACDRVTICAVIQYMIFNLTIRCFAADFLWQSSNLPCPMVQDSWQHISGAAAIAPLQFSGLSSAACNKWVNCLLPSLSRSYENLGRVWGDSDSCERMQEVFGRHIGFKWICGR